MDAINYKITVVNKRKHKPTPHDFYCGRPSPLGNDYSHLDKNTLAKFKVATREEAIQKYEEDWENKIQNENVRKEFFKIYEHLRKHYVVNLLCWCAPASCHCDIIKKTFTKNSSMKLIIKDSENNILFEHSEEVLLEPDIDQIESLNEKEAVSYSVIFADNVKLKQTHDFNALMKHTELIKEVIVTVK